MPNKRKRLPDLPRVLSKVADRVVWTVKPANSDLPLCHSVIHAFLDGSGDPGCAATHISPPDLYKLSYRKILLRCHNGSRQFYFKILLPDFSWRWKRGLRVFTTPAVRQAAWFERCRQLGIGVVDLVGAGVLPWRRRFTLIQPISIIVTSSSLTTKNIPETLRTRNISASQRLLIIRAILDYTERLHRAGIGHLDILPENVLFDAAADKVLLCDLERFALLNWYNKNRRICRDARKVRQTLRLLLSGGN